MELLVEYTRGPSVTCRRGQVLRAKHLSPSAATCATDRVSQLIEKPGRAVSRMQAHMPKKRNYNIIIV